MEKGEKMGKINLDYHVRALKPGPWLESGTWDRMLLKGVESVCCMKVQDRIGYCAVDGYALTGKELQEKKFRGKEITYGDVVA